MIPYSGGTAQVLTDIMGKRIPMVIEAYSGLAGAIQARHASLPLAVASPDSGCLPSPTCRPPPKRLPGFEAGGWQVLVAPAGTPDAIVQTRSMPI